MVGWEILWHRPRDPNCSNTGIAMASICYCDIVRIILNPKTLLSLKVQTYPNRQPEAEVSERERGRETIVSGFRDVWRQQSGSGFIMKAFPSRRCESAISSQNVD